MRWLLNKLVQWNGVPTSHELIDNLSHEQKKAFESDARMILNSPYYKWYVEDLELTAERWMFDGDRDRQLFGKGMLYALQLGHKNISQLASGKVEADSPEKKKMRRFI